MELNQRIRNRRIEIGLSQDELAKRLGYKSRSTINKIELGINDIPQSKVVAFAQALDTTSAYLLGIEDSDIHSFCTDLLISATIAEMKKLNKRGKFRLLETAKEFVCNPLYNDGYELELYAAHRRTDIELSDEADSHDDDIMNADEF